MEITYFPSQWATENSEKKDKQLVKMLSIMSVVLFMVGIIIAGKTWGFPVEL